MLGDQNDFAPKDVVPSVKNANLKPAEILKKASTLRPAELDMGEASREQGFRLNGCR